eukprot:2558083-Amphidinium_carterae.1
MKIGLQLGVTDGDRDTDTMLWMTKHEDNRLAQLEAIVYKGFEVVDSSGNAAVRKSNRNANKCSLKTAALQEHGHTHARTHARTHACTHTHARTHTHTHTHRAMHIIPNFRNCVIRLLFIKLFPSWER